MYCLLEGCADSSQTKGLITDRNTHWPAPYQNEIVAVKLDGSRVERICNTRSIDFTYVAESHGSPSPDGTKVIFASDWDKGTFPVQAYVVDIKKYLKEGSNKSPGKKK